eukprot:TRINITY_DN3093_c0_g1_i1.p1 TRINITY_DN3093_c0_g1~~TRINITY_DN3093_c0_g1_i1.p1  ORF type:complete len:413 (+),score=38.03 TRINITY_DN3093_c0_g1_i1:1903-3141(+)
MSGIARIEDSGTAAAQVLAFVANFGPHAITIREGALIGHATPVQVCESEEAHSRNPLRMLSLEILLLLKSARKFSDSSGHALRPSLPILKLLLPTPARRPLSILGTLNPLRSPYAAAILSKPRRLLDDGIISPSKSPWSSPVVLAKKSDGSWRFCVDYRGLNRVTKKDAYPLPPMEAILDALGVKTAVLWSTLDAASGFWQIHILNLDKEKTAFTTMYGHYEFNVVPFGLHGAPAAFCRAMDQTLRDLLWKVCLVFVDDIVVWGENVDDHLKNLAMVFDALDRDGFTLKLSKCRFCMKEIRYLGHVISEGTIKMDPSKVKAIVDMPPPKNLKELRSFLGMVGWYQRFIERYHWTAKVLEAKLSDKDTTPWTEGLPENPYTTLSSGVDIIYDSSFPLGGSISAIKMMKRIGGW